MNRLSSEASPYLRQHKENPVDWYPFGDEAFATARELDRPLFISIGYSSCHWCHVMAHESFEDEQTAAKINGRFIAVKVDREERPDVDAVYMEAVQALAGQGGWPLTVFATPDGRPFFGGTYFPRVRAHGTPAFSEVLDAVFEAWTTRRDELSKQAEELTALVDRQLGPTPAATRPKSIELVDAAVARIKELYDASYPGFGRSPKFAHGPMIDLLFHADRLGVPGALDMATSALETMASGGIYDHLGGGFARYSVDRAWQIPHFEKMLYDQATLGRCYLHAFQITGDARFRQVLEETLGYVLRELKSPSGGLYSSEDADSGGEEGRFYVWRPEEIRAVLGEERANGAMDWYGVTEQGNFEGGRTVLHRPVRGDLLRSADVEAARSELFSSRDRREHPGLDDKVLTEWNAMMGSTLTEAALATDSFEWRAVAVDIADFLLGNLRRSDRRWLRSYAQGRAAHLAVAADYAWLVDFYTRLGELTGERRFTDTAIETADQLIALFSAPDGGWFTTGADASPLVVRPRDLYDGVTPAASSVAALALARLAVITGSDAYARRSEETVASGGAALGAGPAALSTLVEAALFLDLGAIEVVIVGERPDLVRAAAHDYTPERVLVVGVETPSPLREGRDRDGAYVCRRGVCLAPLEDPDEVGRAIRSAAQAALEVA